MSGDVAVLDASVLLDALLPGDERQPVREALTGYTTLAGPEHLRIEVASVLRRIYLEADPEPPALKTIRNTLAELELTLVPYADIHERIWALRHQLTSYDAAYAAAAEQLGGVLLTADSALGKHPGLRCTVINPRSCS